MRKKSTKYHVKNDTERKEQALNYDSSTEHRIMSICESTVLESTAPLIYIANFIPNPLNNLTQKVICLKKYFMHSLERVACSR